MSKEPTKAQLQGKIAELEANVVMERDAHNVTRDVLHSTELEFAKTRGYLDAKQDAEPPVMVPFQREGHIAIMVTGNVAFAPNRRLWCRFSAKATLPVTMMALVQFRPAGATKAMAKRQTSRGGTDETPRMLQAVVRH